MTDGRKFFDQPIRNDTKKVGNIKELPLVREMITQMIVYQIISISKEKYKMIAIDLSNQ